MEGYTLITAVLKNEKRDVKATKTYFKCFVKPQPLKVSSAK